MRISRRWMCVAAIALAGCGVGAQQRADGMPTSASEEARLAELELGVPPTSGGGEGGETPNAHGGAAEEPRTEGVWEGCG